MDGLVVVEQRSGGLHFANSFSRHFDRLHPKTEYMNLAALLFALQSFASGSYVQDHQGNAFEPPITLFETAAERIALTQISSRQLLLALFVRPNLETVVAK
jgi:hypothetical protein